MRRATGSTGSRPSCCRSSTSWPPSPCPASGLAWRHQKAVYSVLCAAASSTLRDFGLDSRGLGGEIGLTLVLHTHARNLDFHPHCHVVVPGGSLDRALRHWRRKRGRYLFNDRALAKVFRARFLDGINRARLPIPTGVPDAWVVDCRHVGKGEPALKYLSRYLYRGVISERSIVADRDGQVTFTYTDSGTGRMRRRTLPGEDFLWLILQHVLPKGFRRVRVAACTAMRTRAVTGATGIADGPRRPCAASPASIPVPPLQRVDDHRWLRRAGLAIGIALPGFDESRHSLDPESRPLSPTFWQQSH